MALTKNIYALPFKKRDLIKAVSDPRAHFAHFKHAIDFILSEGTKILAAKSGIVVDIKVDSKEGGADPKYNDIKYLNYMTLKHSNDEYSQYAHLKYEGALVKLGEKVRRGQLIALSGNTGFTTAPHLHFHVLKLNKTEIGWETLKIRFEEKVDVDRTKPTIPKELKKTMEELEKIRNEVGNVYLLRRQRITRAIRLTPFAQIPSGLRIARIRYTQAGLKQNCINCPPSLAKKGGYYEHNYYPR